jgi:hypothetical protein
VFPSGANQWGALSFLQGTWDAKAAGNGGAAAMGSYTFRLELRNHTPAPERWKQLSERKLKELAAQMEQIRFMQGLLAR